MRSRVNFTSIIAHKLDFVAVAVVVFCRMILPWRWVFEFDFTRSSRETIGLQGRNCTNSCAWAHVSTQGSGEILKSDGVSAFRTFKELGAVNVEQWRNKDQLSLNHSKHTNFISNLIDGRGRGKSTMGRISNWESHGFCSKCCTNIPFVNVQLFNSLLLRCECCSFSNGEYVKAGLTELEYWCYNANDEYASLAWDELKHIRQAIEFLVIHQTPKKTLDEITHDLFPEFGCFVLGWLDAKWIIQGGQFKGFQTFRKFDDENVTKEWLPSVTRLISTYNETNIQKNMKV